MEDADIAVYGQRISPCVIFQNNDFMAPDRAIKFGSDLRISQVLFFG